MFYQKQQEFSWLIEAFWPLPIPYLSWTTVGETTTDGETTLLAWQQPKFVKKNTESDIIS